MFSPLPMYITARELAKLIESGDQSFVVIDVRDTDYEVGFRKKNKLCCCFSFIYKLFLDWKSC